MRVASVVVLVLVAGLLAGCGTLPIKVTDSYTVQPGQPVGLVASSNSPAVVLGVEVDLEDITFPGNIDPSGLPIDGKFHLIYGAEKK